MENGLTYLCVNPLGLSIYLRKKLEPGFSIKGMTFRRDILLNNLRENALRREEHAHRMSNDSLLAGNSEPGSCYKELTHSGNSGWHRLVIIFIQTEHKNNPNHFALKHFE